MTYGWKNDNPDSGTEPPIMTKKPPRATVQCRRADCFAGVTARPVVGGSAMVDPLSRGARSAPETAIVLANPLTRQGQVPLTAGQSASGG